MSPEEKLDELEEYVKGGGLFGCAVALPSLLALARAGMKMREVAEDVSLSDADQNAIDATFIEFDAALRAFEEGA